MPLLLPSSVKVLPYLHSSFPIKTRTYFYIASLLTAPLLPGHSTIPPLPFPRPFSYTAPPLHHLFLQVVVVLAVAGWGSSSLQRPLFLAVRLASWRQILDPGCTSCCARQCFANCFACCLQGQAPRAAMEAGPNQEHLGGQLAAQFYRHSGLSSFQAHPASKPDHPGPASGPQRRDFRE